jgi:hypothetical protein
MNLLPAEHRARWILSTAARLHEAGAEPVAGLVLPNAQFFPDAFERSARGVRKLLERIFKHAGLSDVPVELTIAGAEPATSSSSCSSGACQLPDAGPMRRLERDGDGYRVTVHAGEVGSPTLLTTALVRAVGAIFVSEAEHAVAPGQLEETVDLASVLLGFGVLSCNGAYIYRKGCGGVNVSSATRLPVEELALALAIFCKLHPTSARMAARELDPTARSCFAEARRWVDSNAHAVELVASDPLAIAAGTYSLSEARSWLSRALGVGRSRKTSVPTAAELERLASDLSVGREDKHPPSKRAQRLAELRELVDEALEN